MAKKDKATTLFVCDVCGEEYTQWQGKCASCGNWNTLKEFKVPATTVAAREAGYSGVASVQPQSLSTIRGIANQRLTTGFKELDRVLGGGIVAGSVILLGGDPGIGKSTLLLQVVDKMAQVATQPILYVTGEESPEQIKLRADRLGIQAEGITILATTNVEGVQATLESNKPALLVIDSIQTMYDPAYPSTPGSIVQVRETALRIQRLAKVQGVPVVMIGHITKEGTVAGPRTLEHLVDVVLYLEGETERQVRIIRAVKNRFGDVAETGIFAMEEKGMVEVINPGSFLLAERIEAPGSVLTAVMEGNRPMLIEVQALTTPSVFGYPRRTASGFDLNRLNLLLAVLQKRASVNLSNQDVFVNIVGGLRVKDPAIDAAVCMAIASAYRGKALSAQMCILGEVGLAGELRQASQQERRFKEVASLGYTIQPTSRQIGQLITQVLGRGKPVQEEEI